MYDNKYIIDFDVKLFSFLHILCLFPIIHPDACTDLARPALFHVLYSTKKKLKWFRKNNENKFIKQKKIHNILSYYFFFWYQFRLKMCPAYWKIDVVISYNVFLEFWWILESLTNNRGSSFYTRTKYVFVVCRS